MLKIVIVDDENDALEALEWKLNRYVDNVEITKCISSIESIDVINNTKPDIVFLDIQMPEMDGFTMIEKVQAALDKVRGRLQADGGDAELVEVTADGIVKVKLTGACHGCPMSQITLKQGIEKMIKADVPEVVSVESV